MGFIHSLEAALRRSRLLSSALFVATAALSPTDALAQEKPVAITGGTIMTGAGLMIPHGTVLLQNGRIKAVGANVTIPPDARRVNARGKFVIPGLIDAQSALFLGAEETGAQGAADRDVMNGADVFDAAAEKVLARGVTTLYLSPGSRGAIAGTGAVVKLRPKSDDPEQPGFARIIKPQAALKATLGLSADNRTSSLQRLASYEALRTAFRAARQYGESFERYERALRVYDARTKQPLTEDEIEDAITGGGGQAAPSRPTKPRKNPAQEVMLKALRREIPVRVEAHRADDILNALRLAKEFGLRLVLEGATEAHAVASEIRKAGIPVVWGMATADGALDIDRRAHWSGGIAKLGTVRLAVSPVARQGLASRFVLENAALTSGAGLPKESALRSVTADAAFVLGVHHRVGSLAPGKDADLVILSASPWDPRARVEQVWVEGEMVRGK
jgi:imidazolonepropionase-like amidohydrolase